jgi:hypothetical protein
MSERQFVGNLNGMPKLKAYKTTMANQVATHPKAAARAAAKKDFQA